MSVSLPTGNQPAEAKEFAEHRTRLRAHYEALEAQRAREAHGNRLSVPFDQRPIA